jgi:hypothetical protein
MLIHTLHEDIENEALLVETARQSQCFLPAIVMTTLSRCHLSPRRGLRRRMILANSRPNFMPSPADRLVGHRDATCRQDLLDLASAQRETEIQPDRIDDEFCREATARIKRGAERCHLGRTPYDRPSAKPQVAQLDGASRTNIRLPAVRQAGGRST